MKKLLTLALLLCLAAPAAFAQLPITFGPKIGLNYSTLIGDTKVISPQYRAGFVGGVFLRLKLAKFYLQPEVLYSAKNSDVNINTTGNTNPPPNPSLAQATVITSSRIKVSALDVPIMLGYKLIDLKLINLRVMAGPVASFKLNGSGLPAVTSANGSTTSASDYFKSASWGYAVGLGVDVAMLTFDARYQSGFSKSVDFSSAGNAYNTANFGGYRDGLFQFSLGWKIL